VLSIKVALFNEASRLLIAALRIDLEIGTNRQSPFLQECDGHITGEICLSSAAIWEDDCSDARRGVTK
jgi:hypothetical protein